MGKTLDLKKTCLIWLPQFEGKKKHFENKIEYFEKKGFENYFIDLEYNSLDQIIKNKFQLLMKPLNIRWTDQIEKELKKINKNCILICHSFAAAFSLIAASKNENVKAVICEGGPFLRYFSSGFRLFHLFYQIKKIPSCLYLVLSYFIFGGPFYKKDLKKALKKLGQKNLPILLMTGEKDRLVPPVFSEEVFKTYPFLKKINFQDTEHLRAYHRHPQKYTDEILKFISELSLNGN